MTWYDYPITYIRFFVFLIPIILPTMAVLGSAFEQNPNGLLYVVGLSMAMGIGKCISLMAKKPVPHIGTIGEPDFLPLIDPACTLIQGGDPSKGWGSAYSLPGPHALLLSFTTTYLLFPMFINDNVNLLLIGTLILLMAMSAYMRVSAPMNCVYLVDVVAGWGTGFIFGTIWFGVVVGLLHAGDYTYFSNTKSDKQECKLDKKAFRCKSKKKAN